MSYVKIVDYAIKDVLVTGDPNKIVRGSEIDAEFDAIATASAVTDAAYIAADVVVASNAAAATALKLDTSVATSTYAPLNSPALVGTPTAPTAAVGTNSQQLATMASLLNQAFTTGFPTQTGNDGKYLTTNGATPSWASLTIGVARSNRTSNTVLVVADIGKIIDITSGTFSQTFTAAATLGAGWSVWIKNSGSGDITLDPNASELIDGLSTYIMYPGECRLITCDGSAFTSTVITPFSADSLLAVRLSNRQGIRVLEEWLGVVETVDKELTT